MSFLRHASCAAIALAVLAPGIAAAAPQALVSGQTLTLPLTEESDGAALTFLIDKATLKGASGRVKGETRAEANARGGQVVLDDIEGRNLVTFARFAAEDLRTRYASKGKAVKVVTSFDEGLTLNVSEHLADSMKAGLTLGLATPSTTPYFFNSHMDFMIEEDGAAPQTTSCDAREPGRLPLYPKKNDPNAHAELDRMQDVGRKACFTQIVAKLNGEPAADAAATPAAPTPNPTDAVS